METKEYHMIHFQERSANAYDQIGMRKKQHLQ